MARLGAEQRVTLLANDSDKLQLVFDGVEVATNVGVGKRPNVAWRRVVRVPSP